MYTRCTENNMDFRSEWSLFFSLLDLFQLAWPLPWLVFGRINSKLIC